jgi:hypothetical protein
MRTDPCYGTACTGKTHFQVPASKDMLHQFSHGDVKVLCHMPVVKNMFRKKATDPIGTLFWQTL